MGRVGGSDAAGPRVKGAVPWTFESAGHRPRERPGPDQAVFFPWRARSCEPPEGPLGPPGHALRNGTTVLPARLRPARRAASLCES